MPRILMVGFNDEDKHRYHGVVQPDDEIWTCVDFFSYTYRHLNPKICFQIHPNLFGVHWNTTGRDFLFADEYAKWPDMTVVVGRHEPLLKNPQAVFRNEDYVDYFGRDVLELNSIFCSSPAMMLAMAGLRGHNHVHLHGFAMWQGSLDIRTGTLRGEAMSQGVPLMWLVDWLRANKGMRIEWPRESMLRKGYGALVPFWNPMPVEMKYGEHKDDVFPVPPIAVAAQEALAFEIPKAT